MCVHARDTVRAQSGNVPAPAYTHSGSRHQQAKRAKYQYCTTIQVSRGSSRKIPTSLPGRSTRQTVSTRVHSLSTRSREPFRTSLDLTDTYGTPGDISILFLVGRRHGANHAMFEASALHRATMPSHATYRSVESVRSRHESMPQACTSHA